MEAYPIVLQELDLVYKMYYELEKINVLNVQQIVLTDKQILKLGEMNVNYEKQIDLLKSKKHKTPLINYVAAFLTGLIVSLTAF